MDSTFEWVPITTRFPEDEYDEYFSTPVIMTLAIGWMGSINNRSIYGTYNFVDKKFYFDNIYEHRTENVTDHVVAWAYLPKPYEKEN